MLLLATIMEQLGTTTCDGHHKKLHGTSHRDLTLLYNVLESPFVTNEARCYRQHQSPKEAHQVTRSAQSPEHAAARLTASLPET